MSRTIKDKVLDQFIDSLNVFMEAYEGNVGNLPYGLLLGPQEYLFLCMWEHRASGAEPNSEQDELDLPLVTDFKGVPVRVKFTRGAEAEIDPVKAFALASARKDTLRAQDIQE